MIQSSVPSGDLKNPLWPGPKAPCSACIEKTGSLCLLQSSFFIGSPPSVNESSPNAYWSDEKWLAEYTTKTLPSGPTSGCGPSLTALFCVSHVYSGAVNSMRSPSIVHGLLIFAMYIFWGAAPRLDPDHRKYSWS